MGFRPLFLGGVRGNFLETGMLENVFPDILGHETQTFEG